MFEPYQMGSIKLSNRIIMAPMTRSRAIGNVANDMIAEYYTQRASAGLIISEGIAPSPNGLGYARIPGLFNEAQVASWKKVTDAVHNAGSKIFAQIMHTGRVSHSANMPAGAKVLAPSAVAATGDIWTDIQAMQPMPVPEAMTAAEVESTIQEYVLAAENAIAAGFDGIELHSANGYLLEQFLNPGVNQRTDNYGGSIENRARFVIEVAAAVANKIGKEKVGLRISPYNPYNSMPAYHEVFATYDYLSKELNKIGILYLHMIDYAARATEEGQALIQTIRNNFTNTLILNGGYNRERAEEVLTNGLADAISFGSPFVSNPNLPHKLQHAVDLKAADPALFFSAGAEGFTDYPLN